MAEMFPVFANMHRFSPCSRKLKLTSRLSVTAKAAAGSVYRKYVFYIFVKTVPTSSEYETDSL